LGSDRTKSGVFVLAASTHNDHARVFALLHVVHEKRAQEEMRQVVDPASIHPLISMPLSCIYASFVYFEHAAITARTHVKALRLF